MSKTPNTKTELSACCGAERESIGYGGENLGSCCSKCGVTFVPSTPKEEVSEHGACCLIPPRCANKSCKCHSPLPPESLSWVEKLERVIGLYFNAFIPRGLKEKIIKMVGEIREEGFKQGVEKEFPMGVSQWRNHGEKYGYDKFFEEKAKVDTRKEIIDSLKERIEGMKKEERYPYDNSMETIAITYNQALDDTIALLSEDNNKE